MGRRVISFSLTPSDIDRAIREVQRFESDFLKKCDEVIRELKDLGVTTAITQITAYGAIDTGELVDSIKGYYNSETRTGIVYAGAGYAAFVEYGTGVVGESSPHPASVLLWKYDIHNHGVAGWVYVSDRDGKRHWTMGQPSRPFMYRTMEILARRAPDIAERIFQGL